MLSISPRVTDCPLSPTTSPNFRVSSCQGQLCAKDNVECRKRGVSYGNCILGRIFTFSRTLGYFIAYRYNRCMASPIAFFLFHPRHPALFTRYGYYDAPRGAGVGLLSLRRDRTTRHTFLPFLSRFSAYADLPVSRSLSLFPSDAAVVIIGERSATAAYAAFIEPISFSVSRSPHSLFRTHLALPQNQSISSSLSLSVPPSIYLRSFS